MTREEKINRIKDAAKTFSFKDGIFDIDILSFEDKNGKLSNDLFNFVDMEEPHVVHFIGGTGYDDFEIPLEQLTDESLDVLCSHIK